MNVFKSILVIKSHSVIDLYSVVSLLWGYRPRPKVIFCVHADADAHRCSCSSCARRDVMYHYHLAHTSPLLVVLGSA